MKTQEEFLQKFFARQRKISKQALDTTQLLARTNIEAIVWTGLASPVTHNKMDEIIKEMRAENEKKSAVDLNKKIEALQKRKEELSNGDKV